MNMNRPDMTEDVKSKDYTNKSLQKDSNPVTMKASGASCSMRIFCQKSQAISDETSDKSPAIESVSYTHLSDAMVTTLVAKDRVLAHNPCGAIYCAEGYFKKRLE